MNDLLLYLELGLKHILDVNGYDHILFIIVLICLHSFKNLKQILILVTAFTLGHSITLAISTLDILTVDSDFIELLIPITICLTASKNILSPSKNKNIKFNYLLAIVFGTIHGMGFSNYLKSILVEADEILIPLLGFNIGLEIGQIIIVLLFLILRFLLLGMFNIQKRDWVMVISSIVMGMCIFIMLK